MPTVTDLERMEEAASAGTSGTNDEMQLDR